MSPHKPWAKSKHSLFRFGYPPGPQPAHTPCRPKHGRLEPQILLEGTLSNADDVNYPTELCFPQEKVVHLLLTRCSQVLGLLHSQITRTTRKSKSPSAWSAGKSSRNVEELPFAWTQRRRKIISARGTTLVPVTDHCSLITDYQSAPAAPAINRGVGGVDI